MVVGDVFTCFHPLLPAFPPCPGKGKREKKRRASWQLVIVEEKKVNDVMHSQGVWESPTLFAPNDNG